MFSLKDTNKCTQRVFYLTKKKTVKSTEGKADGRDRGWGRNKRTREVEKKELA